MPASPPPCSILLLAGGRGARLGGADKGLVEWQGRPLIAWLHDLTRALTDDLIISCNRNADAYAPYADRLVHDAEADFPGPLAGLRAALAVARHPHLLVLSCDAPRLDGPLLQALRAAAAAHPERTVMVRHGTQWEPLLSLVPTTLAPALEAAWQAGERSPRRALLALGAVALACPAGDARLVSLDTPEALAAARRLPPSRPSADPGQRRGQDQYLDQSQIARESQGQHQSQRSTPTPDLPPAPRERAQENHSTGDDNA